VTGLPDANRPKRNDNPIGEVMFVILLGQISDVSVQHNEMMFMKVGHSAYQLLNMSRRYDING